MVRRPRLIPWGSQPQEAVGVADEFAFDYVWLWNSLTRPSNLGRAAGGLSLLSGTASVVPGSGGLGLAFPEADGRLEIAGNPFGSVGTYLWAESAQTLHTNGSCVITSKYATTANPEVGSLHIRLSGSDIQLIRGQQAVVINGAGGRIPGRLNVGAVSIAGDGTSRKAVFGNGRLLGASTAASNFAHGISAIGNGPTADNVRMFGPLHYVAFTPHVLSDDALRFLTANPWQLFAPQRIYVPRSTGAPAIPNLAALARTNVLRPRYTWTP